MKTIVKGRLWRAVILFGFTILAVPLQADEPTAFALIKEANRYVGEQAKDKVVQIRSEKSIGGLVPSIWYVRFFDHTATFRITEVKFGAGTMLDVDRPLHVWKKITGADEPLDRAQLKIDSDRAIELATREPLLKHLQLTATELKLERGASGEPVWKVKLWAAKLRKPTADVSIGEIILSAKDGKLLQNDLKIQRVD